MKQTRGLFYRVVGRSKSVWTGYSFPKSPATVKKEIK